MDGQRPYHLRLGCSLAGAWSILLFIAIAYREVHHGIWGPANTIVFWGVSIDTWSRWTCMMMYSCVSQMVQSVVSGTLNPYVTNVVRDHKCVDRGAVWVAHVVVQVRSLFTWLTELFGMYIVMTMQFQFIIPAIATDLVMRALITRHYMRPKKWDTVA